MVVRSIAAISACGVIVDQDRLFWAKETPPNLIVWVNNQFEKFLPLDVSGHFERFTANPVKKVVAFKTGVILTFHHFATNGVRRREYSKGELIEIELCTSPSVNSFGQIIYDGCVCNILLGNIILMPSSPFDGSLPDGSFVARDEREKQNAATAAQVCPDCKGTKKIALLHSTVPCKRCK